MRLQFAIVLALIPIVASCARKISKPQPASAIIERERARQLGERRLMAAQSLSKWYAHQEEGGAARTPLFIELRNDAFWQTLLAQLVLSDDKNARIAVMSAGMTQVEGMYHTFFAHGQDSPRIQMAQTRFDLAMAGLLQDLIARDDVSPVSMHEAAVVKFPHEVFVAAQNRAARAQEVVDLAADRIAESESVEDWMGALSADAIKKLLRSRLALERTQETCLAAADDVRKQCERLTSLVAASKPDSSSQAASLWVMYELLNVDFTIDSIRQRAYGEEDIRTTLTSPELINISEQVNESFNRFESGDAETALSWMTLRSRWARRAFECQIAAANNIEARISAVDAYLAEIKHCENRVALMTKDRSLASAIWRYHLADAEFERICIAYAPVN